MGDIKIIEGNIFDSKANFIVHQTNCQGVMGSGIALQVAQRFPHVEIAYRKYLQRCKKNHVNPLGTAQYVPSEYWALVMVDAMKNDNVIAFDTNYQYIVNLFGQDAFGAGMHTDLNAMKKAFVDIREKAEKIGATVAMPYKIGSCRGGAEWSDIYDIIKQVFGKSSINVEIWKDDLG